MHIPVYLSLITMIKLISSEEHLNLIMLVSWTTNERKTQQVINSGWGAEGGCGLLTSDLALINYPAGLPFPNDQDRLLVPLL